MFVQLNISVDLNNYPIFRLTMLHFIQVSITKCQIYSKHKQGMSKGKTRFGQNFEFVK